MVDESREFPGIKSCRIGFDRQFHPRDWVSRPIIMACAGETWNVRETRQPCRDYLLLAFADGYRIPLLPKLERCHRADDILFSSLHAATDSAILKINGADEVALASNNPTRRAA